MKSLSRPTLCDPVDCSLPGSSIHGILQARILERVAISFSRGSSWPRDWTWVSGIAGRRFTLWATREALKFWAKGHCECTRINYCCSVAKLCPTLCDPMDCSLPSFFIHGTSQAGILEWVVISFSKINLWYWCFSRSEWYSDWPRLCLKHLQ